MFIMAMLKHVLVLHAVLFSTVRAAWTQVGPSYTGSSIGGAAPSARICIVVGDIPRICAAQRHQILMFVKFAMVLSLPQADIAVFSGSFEGVCGGVACVMVTHDAGQHWNSTTLVESTVAFITDAAMASASTATKASPSA